MEACKGAEAIVIATEWKEFKDIAWEEVYASMNKPAFVFDGRLLVDAEHLSKIGFKVRPVGRSFIRSRRIGYFNWSRRILSIPYIRTVADHISKQ